MSVLLTLPDIVTKEENMWLSISCSRKTIEVICTQVTRSVYHGHQTRTQKLVHILGEVLQSEKLFKKEEEANILIQV